MYTQIDVSTFRETFKAYGRQDNFSYNGLNALFEYLEQFEEDTGEKIEFDCIAICCDFNEDTIEYIVGNYPIDLDDCQDDADIKQAVLDYLENNTSVVAVLENTILYQVF